MSRVNGSGSGSQANVKSGGGSHGGGANGAAAKNKAAGANGAAGGNAAGNKKGAAGGGSAGTDKVATPSASSAKLLGTPSSNSILPTQSTTPGAQGTSGMTAAIAELMAQLGIQ